MAPRLPHRLLLRVMVRLFGSAAVCVALGVRIGIADPAPSPLGALPPGWKIAITDVIALFSPGTAAGSVTVIAPPVLATVGDVKSAFTEEVPALIEDILGESRSTAAPVPLPASDAVAPGLMLELSVVLDDGTEARLEATGYPVAGGRLQVFFVAAPAGMEDDDPDLRTARSLVDQWRTAGVIVTADVTAQLSGTQNAAGSEDADDGTAPVSAAAAPAPEPPTSPEDRIENVIHYLRFVFDGKNPGAAAEPQSITALLLRDGRVFESEPRAPADFEPLTRPPGSPGTGRWQRDGEAYALAFGDGTQGTAVAAAAKTFAAPAALSLTGTYVASGGPARDVLPDRLAFFGDGSLILAGGEGGSRSARYRISRRTIEIEDEGGARHAFLFGYQGDPARPDLLILANRVYEREEEASPQGPSR